MNHRSLLRAAVACAALIGAACGGDATGPATTDTKDLVIATTILTGTGGSSFVSAIAGLASASVNNQTAREVTPYPYLFVRGNDVFVTGNGSTDNLLKFTRGADGVLVPSGTLALPAGGQPSSMEWISDSKAYVSLTGLGKLAVVNPQTMTLIKTIDVSGGGIAWGDNNSEPDQIVVRDGKVFVALLQYGATKPIAHDSVSVVVLDAATDAILSTTLDTRSSTAGGEGNTRKFFVDENGDLYLNCIASYGYGGNSKPGILRIKRGATTFDPTYFLDLDAASAAAGKRIDYINMLTYAGNGIAYATANVPSLASVPPDYVHDHTMAAIKVDLANKTVTLLPIPYSNGYAASVLFYKGKALFGMSAVAGIGLFVYDPATGVAGTTPAVMTQGDPTSLKAFP